MNDYLDILRKALRRTEVLLLNEQTLYEGLLIQRNAIMITATLGDSTSGQEVQSQEDSDPQGSQSVTLTSLTASISASATRLGELQTLYDSQLLSLRKQESLDLVEPVGIPEGGW